MHSLELDDVFEQKKLNQQLIKARQRHDKELARVKENYQIAMQILKQTLRVKMSY